MRIGIDAMGGDFAPLEVIKGALIAKNELPGNVDIILIGQEDAIHDSLSRADAPKDSFEIVTATQVITMEEHPTKAFSQKKDSSISKGYGLLKHGNIDAFVSTGNTGAMLVGAMYGLQNIPGVIRPTISASVPKADGKMGLLLDVGANSDCKPDTLCQFGILGYLYCKHVLKMDNPNVGLLNIGEEEGKGNLLTQAAYPLMKDAVEYEFYGNIEGRDIFSDKADVIVCDGFTGNVMLKTIEGMYELMRQNNISHPFFDKLNYESYGGTPILGTNAPVIIGHGISKAPAFKSMIFLAKKVVEANLVEIFKSTFN